MDEINLLKKELFLEKELFKIEASEKLSKFLLYVNESYSLQWFHELIADKCQQLLEGKFNRLMVFLPPQHGKSEIVSRIFPAFALGKFPNLKIAGASYSSDLAHQFSRAIQRVIDTNEYYQIFPDTTLNKSNIRTNAIGGGFIRNIDVFEVVGKKGFYKAVGVCGSLTGTAVDLAIIDDPVKDAIQAYSATYRERVWDWYINVLLTRLHNDSKQVIIMTRWHDDDLAGRLLKKEPEKWEIICIPAIKENHITSGYDQREIGAALWPDKHNIESLLDQKARSERTFASLYQQRPAIDGGNIIKSDWFGKVSLHDFSDLHSFEPIVYFVDTAFTDKQKNDPTGIIATCRLGPDLYISAAQKSLLKFPDLIRFIPKFVNQTGYGPKSSIRIEPKANGLSVIQQLKESTHLNVMSTPSPTESKETRLNAASPAVESGRVILVDGSWNDEFITEVCGFPSKEHDEYVDLLCYAIDYHKIGREIKKQDLSGIFF